MPYQDPDEVHDELALTLGPDNTFGFHIELLGQTPIFWDKPRRGDGTRFPCIDEGNEYSGCLGAACRAESCWAGRLVPSAVHADQESLNLPSKTRMGVKCHSCTHAVDAEDGLVDCTRHHFNRPISHACLIRQRVPETVPIPCPDYEAASEIRPELKAYRRSKREQSARRKAVREGRVKGSPG